MQTLSVKALPKKKAYLGLVLYLMIWKYITFLKLQKKLQWLVLEHLN